MSLSSVWDAHVPENNTPYVPASNPKEIQWHQQGKKERNINIGGIFWRGERSQWGKGEGAENNQNVSIPKVFNVYLFNFKGGGRLDTERDVGVECQILNPESSSELLQSISILKWRQDSWEGAHGKWVKNLLTETESSSRLFKGRESSQTKAWFYFIIMCEL